MASHPVGNPVWTSASPLLALACVLIGGIWGDAAWLTALTAVILIACVLAAVHHAEVIAHRIGEPFGTLVLALAVTIIEVALIVSVMLGGGADAAVLPRDTVFATVMIVCNGVVGGCLLLGGLRHVEQRFHVEGASSLLAALLALSCLTLVLPSFTTTLPEPVYSRSQLEFAAGASLILWLAFVFVQTVRHRDYFLPADAEHDGHAPPPAGRVMLTSVVMLPLALVGVVGLAKRLSPAIEAAVNEAGLPSAVIGVAIAMLVLLPETVAALRAALANRVQTSLNLALGSGLASIGLTIPVVAVVSILLDMPLTLGLEPKDMSLLVLTMLVSTITLGTGRSTMLQGVIHLVVFAAFLFLSVVP